jgi:hypothetical protein
MPSRSLVRVCLVILTIFVLLISSFTLTGIRFVTASTGKPTPQSNPFHPAPTAAGNSTPANHLPLPNVDEEMGMTFTQNFTSILYNVTAVSQVDFDGFGAGYFLNGLTTQGYWYQVGLTLDWPGSPSLGFLFIYEVWNPNGSSVYPTSGGAGLSNFGQAVNPNDTVSLNLYFSGSNLVMQAHDWNAGVSVTQIYSAEGATEFVGSHDATTNQNGYFTGLMTEQYHYNPYFGNEYNVRYENSNYALSSAWLWSDEWDTGTTSILFYAATPNPLSFALNPTLPQHFSANGTSEALTAYSLVTGSLGSAPTTTITSTNVGHDFNYLDIIIIILVIATMVGSLFVVIAKKSKAHVAYEV